MKCLKTYGLPAATDDLQCLLARLCNELTQLGVRPLSMTGLSSLAALKLSNSFSGFTVYDVDVRE